MHRTFDIIILVILQMLQFSNCTNHKLQDCCCSSSLNAKHLVKISPQWGTIVVEPQSCRLSDSPSDASHVRSPWACACGRAFLRKYEVIQWFTKLVNHCTVNNIVVRPSKNSKTVLFGIKMIFISIVLNAIKIVW